MRNPANYRTDPSTGLSAVTPPGDPLPHLAALVAAGELTHADLVLPTVPKSREAVRHWLAFCETHQEIVYATGNPSYTALSLKGTQPVHLNLWFRYEDKAVVQPLIRQLQEKFTE